MTTTSIGRALAALAAATLYTFGGAGAAGAGTPSSGSASAFAVTADVFGTNAIPPTPTAETAAPAADETSNTVIGIPGDPLVVSGTLIARSAVKGGLASELNQTDQAVGGPYDARAIGQIEDLSVLIDEAVPGGSLVSADVIRSEAVAVCTASGAQYSAGSEVVDLQIGGEDPLSGPINEALKQITDGLAPLADLISVELNVTDVTSTGASVDAVVITLLKAAADNGAPGPLAKVVLGHAEVSGVACSAATTPPQCSDGVDNDGDALVDADDPGCHEGDDLSAPYHPEDDDERNTIVEGAVALPSDGGQLALTGARVPVALATVLAAAGLGLFALRRRLTA